MKVSEMLQTRVSLGGAVMLHGLGVLTLLGDGTVKLPAVDLLEEAIGRRSVRITETTESGEVPFLSLVNEGDRPVLILEGEELVGGKQNRIVNTSMIIQPGVALKVPVSCMEAGRWAGRNEEFHSGEAIFRARSRAVHKQNVSFSLHTEGSFRGEQGAVWDEVQLSLSELRAASPTSDFRAGRAQVAQRIEEFVEGLGPVDGQIGAIFFSRTGVIGAELLGTEELYRKACEKIIRSFAFEVLLDPDLDSRGFDSVEKWWSEVLNTEATLHPSPGVGRDIRCSSRNVIGSGLYWHEACVHFSCFPGQRDSEKPAGPKTRRASAGERVRRLKNR